MTQDNPDISFETRTNWCVITGAPSSGKTSVLMELARRGHHVEHEAARSYITDRLEEGLTLEQVRADEAALQTALLKIKLDREHALDSERLIFWDRGMPDSVSYYKLAKLDPSEAIAASKVFHYAHVFIFDRLPLVKDGVRSETEETADWLDAQIEDDYRMLGYEPMRVPVMSIIERADFILENIDGAGIVGEPRQET